jgi:Domain of unknown function (DUF4389)
MHTLAHDLHATTVHPVNISVAPDLGSRNRLTTAFRPILAIPHLMIVGGPIVMALGWSSQTEPGGTHEWGASGGALGAVAAAVAVIAWFAILFTGRYPDGLWNLAAFYLRWRVRAATYMTLLRDEYPPFGDAPYPASLAIDAPTAPRDRLSVAVRLLLILPHLVVLCALGIGWILATVFAWFAILFTGRYPASLAPFSLGVLRWNIRVEAYMLLLHDDYPPFRLAA